MIIGEGLVLRPPVPDDRERWLELFGDADHLRFSRPTFVEVPTSVEDLDERVRGGQLGAASCAPGTLVVTDAGDEIFLGILGWRQDVPVLRIADIGYSVHPDARGRGVATRAVRLLVAWLTTAPDGPDMVRVQLDHSVENPASCRTALAAGLEQEGIRRGFLPLLDPGPDGQERRHDVCLHGFLPRPR